MHPTSCWDYIFLQSREQTNHSAHCSPRLSLLTVADGSFPGDAGTLANALNVSDRERELVSICAISFLSQGSLIILQCRNYFGLHLNDMHALVEHLEEVHCGAYNHNSVHPQAQMQLSQASQPIREHSNAQVPTHQPSHVGSSQVSSAHAHIYDDGGKQA